jgi:GAF domain-containing protein
MYARPEIAKALAMASRTLSVQQSLEETLDVIVQVARDSIPGFDHVGISTLDKHGKAETRAGTDQLVWELDAVQYGLDEGPCVDSLHQASVVTAPDIRCDQRWPRYVPQAVEHGVQSQLAVKLSLDDRQTIGGLNLYSTSTAEIDPEAEHVAELFAAHASIALGHANDREHLNEALHSRKVIGQALGIVMERYRIDEDRAFAFLVRASSTSNLKLRDIAQELVDQGNNGPTRH